jgi:hypothetical protein
MGYGQKTIIAMVKVLLIMKKASLIIPRKDWRLFSANKGDWAIAYLRSAVNELS